MSQLNINVLAPLGYTGPNLTGDNNDVQIIDEFGNNVFKSPGSGNICVGTTSGYNLSSGAGNTLLGNSSGYEITIGSSNTCLGNGAGGTITGGPGNTFIGANAGNASSSYAPFIGGNNICIGSGSFASTSAVFNEITLGNSAITTLRCAVTSITSLSDERDKTNIKESDYGIEFVNSLKPVKFEWDTRDGAKKGIKDLGFIAQDLKELDDEHLNLVYDENPEKLEASYGRLIPVLVKAIQDLSKEIETLKNK